MNTHFLSDFTISDALGRNLYAFVTIKGFNQLAIVKKIIERKGKKSLGLTAASNASERRYATGNILLTTLDQERLDETTLADSVQRIDCLEPYHVAINGRSIAYTAGPQFKWRDYRSNQAQTFTNEWMAYLHTVDFSADGRRILTVSTGFDTIQEIDLATGQVCWEWNAWDHGFTYSPRIDTHFVRSEAHAASLQNGNPAHNVTVIDDPSQLPREGLPTQATPLNLNGVFYGRSNQILATAYHRPELFVIERNGRVRLINRQLAHPHSFRPLTIPDHNGYMVANTGAGQLLLLDETFAVVTKVDVSTLPADASKKQGFGEWLQTVSVLYPQRGLFAAVDALRNGIHLIDLPNRRRRFITNPPHWTIQTVICIPARLLAEIKPDEHLDAIQN